MIDPALDGFEHINIYSQGQTPLGRMLSNFTHYKIKTADGWFESVEGYWHWLGIEECLEKEELRQLYGIAAKKRGNELRKIKQAKVEPEFQDKILKAIWYKVKRNQWLFDPKYDLLPLEHYYVFKGAVRDVKEKYLWMIDGIDKMRKYIAGHRAA